MPDLFEVLKRPRLHSEPRSMTRPERFHFRVRIDADGGWLDLCDGTGAALPEHSHEWASGAERELLKSMRSIEERESERFSWLPRPGGISLAAHEHLMELLERCPEAVDGDLKPLEFAAEPGELVARLLPMDAGEPGAEPATAPPRVCAEMLLRLADTECVEPRRLLLTLRGSDPLLALLLEDVADSVAPGVYRLSTAKILARRAGQTDVIARLDKLIQMLPEELPPLWREHLRRLKDRAAPPKAESFSVYKLDPGSELAAVIAQTPELAELALRAEGGHILVKRLDHERFSAKLQSLGFIPPKA